MAINRVDYGDETLIDLTQDTVTPQTLAAGYTAHGADGNQIQGQANFGSGGGGGTEKVTVPISMAYADFGGAVAGTPASGTLPTGTTFSGLITDFADGKNVEVFISLSDAPINAAIPMTVADSANGYFYGSATVKASLGGAVTTYSISCQIRSSGWIVEVTDLGASDIFLVNATSSSADKSYSEIATAVSAGKIVKMRYSYYELNLAAATTGLAMFSITGVQDLSGTRMLVTIQITIDSNDSVTMTTDLVPVTTT